MSLLSLSKEAEAKIKTLVECFNFHDESAAINELFFQFIMSKDSDTRQKIMAIYKINVNGRP